MPVKVTVKKLPGTGMLDPFVVQQVTDVIVGPSGDLTIQTDYHTRNIYAAGFWTEVQTDWVDDAK